VKQMLLLLVIVALVGCASSGSGGQGRSRGSQSAQEAKQAKAANINVELAIGYLQEGRVELALEKVERALDQNPRSAPAHSVAGVIKERVGRMDEARTHYERSVRLDPDNGDLLNNYGQFLCKMGDYDEAVDNFARAIEQPFYETPQVALGNACFCQYKAGELANAEAFCRQAIDADPRYGDAYYLLSRAFLQRYQAIGPDTPATLSLCVKIERAMNDREAANDCQQTLKRNYPDSPEARELETREVQGG